MEYVKPQSSLQLFKYFAVLQVLCQCTSVHQIVYNFANEFLSNLLLFLVIHWFLFSIFFVLFSKINFYKRLVPNNWHPALKRCRLLKRYTGKIILGGIRRSLNSIFLHLFLLFFIPFPVRPWRAEADLPYHPTPFLSAQKSDGPRQKRDTDRDIKPNTFCISVMHYFQHKKKIYI